MTTLVCCDDDPLVAQGVHGPAGKDIEKACQGIYPLQSTYIRKVKILRAPRFDIQRLMEVHGDYTEETGSKLDRPAEDVVGAEAEPEAAAEA